MQVGFTNRSQSRPSSCKSMGRTNEGRGLTMLTILLPSWAAWMLVVAVVVLTVWIWALCRAAALGDEMMFRVLQQPGAPSPDSGRISLVVQADRSAA